MDSSYTSQEVTIMARAKKKGIAIAALNGVFEKTLDSVTKEHGGRSVVWRLARAEFLVWCHFFPGETFPSLVKKAIKEELDDQPSPFPKALHAKAPSMYEEASRKEWVHDKFQAESPTRNSYGAKEIDSYRPEREKDSYRPALKEHIPLARAGVEKPAVGNRKKGMKIADRGILNALPNGTAIRVSAPAVFRDNKLYRSQKDLMHMKALEAGISRADVDECLESKADLAVKKFEGRSGDWQMFFVEASTWGRFFKGQPFPGIEPSKHPEPSKQEPASLPQSASLQEYLGITSERVMEKKAVEQHTRRDFFRYLQKMRTYSRSQHPTEACDHIRGWFADHLTWRNFFGSAPFPFAQPPGELNASCAACSMLPKFAPLSNNTMNQVMKAITATGGRSMGGQFQKVGKSSAVIGAPSGPAALRKGGVSPTKALAKETTGAQNTTKTLAQLASDPRTAPITSRPAAPVPQPAAATNSTAPANRTAQQTAQTQQVAPLSRRDQRTPPPSIPTRHVVEDVDFHSQSVAPAYLTTKLAMLWAQDPFMGKGTVVMVNAVSLVYNKSFVGELFNCFTSDTKQAIAGIGAELRCNILYCVLSTGDLFLWTEPYIPGDESSFNRGHMFITGWIARVSSFGMVKPSVHWNAIRTPLAPFQALPPAKSQPINTVNALSLLSKYVNAAVADKPKPVVVDRSAYAGKGQSMDVEMTNTAAEKSALSLLPKPQPEPSEATTPTSSATLVYPAEFENPENQWHKYKVAFRTSDIDRLMMEETVKNEGDLRMVLDRDSGQIVSVEELVKRTVHRCSLKARSAGSGVGDGVPNLRNGLDEPANKKRKAVDDESGDREGGQEEKRARPGLSLSFEF